MEENTAPKKKKLFTKIMGDRVIWIVLFAFVLISLLVVYSSSSSLAYRHGTTTFTYFFKQLFFFAVGFVCLLICYRIPLGVYRKGAFIFLIISAVLLILPIVSGGDPRRFAIFGITIQPSEIAKIAIVLYLARVLEISKMETFKEYALKILIPLGIICTLSLIGSVSATLIIGGISIVILVCSGVKWKYLLYTGAMIVAFIAIVWTLNHFTHFFPRLDTFEARVERFISSDKEEMTPEELKEYNDKNFQAEQSRDAIQLGGLFGRGPGNSIKRDMLPNAYDDYIFSTIIEEYGLFGAIIIMTLYMWLFYRCILIAISCQKPFSTIVVLGLSLLIIIQALLHILVNVGIFPVTGQTLPMISQGGTSIVILSCAFGIILSVNRTIEVKVEMEKKEQNETIKEEENGK